MRAERRGKGEGSTLSTRTASKEAERIRVCWENEKANSVTEENREGEGL